MPITAEEEEVQSNVYPIPIHQPTGLGGMADLMTITQSDVVGFRSWVAEYKKRLFAAHDEVGDGHYKEIQGIQCFNDIEEMDEHVEDPESACGQFLSVLGFTDENFAEIDDIWDMDEVEHIHYVWKPQYRFAEADFNYFLSQLQGEMSGIEDIIVSHTSVRYAELQFPDDNDRPAVSMQSLGYDILEEDAYADIGDTWEGTGTNGKDKRTEEQLFFGISSVKFYDLLGVEVIKDPWVVNGITSLLTVSMNEAITTEAIVKTGESSDTIGTPPGTVWEVHAEETIDINFSACTYDRYYIGDEETDYAGDTGSGYSTYYPYYINLFWESRTLVISSSNPENDIVNMFIMDDDGKYYMRADFEKVCTPDQIAYLISAFSYIEIEEEEKKGGFIRGIIGAILFVGGAWLFYHGAKGAAEFLWKVAYWAVGLTIGNLIEAEFTEMYEQMAAENEAQNQELQEQQLADAARDNTRDLSFTYDYYDKLEPINPYAAGLFNPARSCQSSSNPYTVGGTYWQPHTQLINQRDIL